MTNCIWGLSLIFGLGELPARQLRIAADFGLFAGVATNELRPSPTSAACRRATNKLGASPTLAACRWATSKLVILDLVSEERAESVGNPCRNIYDGYSGAEPSKVKLAKVWKDSHPISTQPIVSTHPTHFFSPNLSTPQDTARIIPSSLLRDRVLEPGSGRAA
ncbi:hypothetical protein, partial [Mesorhizobium sp. YR577]|uniref:hypothetical protein n=1 Tax=Mesorhizobium sp. YR577 TaxID=1884373 RepID=UPI0008F3BA8F